MVHSRDGSAAAKRNPLNRRSCRSSAPLFLPAPFLDSNSVAGKSTHQDACDVGPLDVAGDNSSGPLVARWIGAAGAADVPLAVGAIALPAALFADGEILQHAVGGRAAHDLRRKQMVGASAKSAMAIGVCLLGGRASIHALSARAGDCRGSLPGIPGNLAVVAEDPRDAPCRAGCSHRALVPTLADRSLRGDWCMESSQYVSSGKPVYRSDRPVRVLVRFIHLWGDYFCSRHCTWH